MTEEQYYHYTLFVHTVGRLGLIPSIHAFMMVAEARKVMVDEQDAL